MPAGIASIVMLLATAAGSALLTQAWILLARRRQINDLPGPRRMHSVPTPRGGGIAIAVVFLLALSWLSLPPSHASGLMSLALGAGLFAALGLFDDLSPLPTALKFGLQLVAAALLVAGIAGGWALGWIGLAVLVVACCYVVNIWNFMDGSNGLIAVQALLIAFALAFWPGQPEYLRMASLALAGACLGFLPFNLPTARVFLGDVGSHAIGAAVFGLLLLAWQEKTLDLLQVLLVSSVIVLDTGYTLARRLLSGKRVWLAHRDHLFQYAVRVGHSHAKVCLIYGAATVAAIALARIAGKATSNLVGPALLALVWLLGTVLYFGLRQHWLNPAMHRHRRHE